MGKMGGKFKQKVKKEIIVIERVCVVSERWIIVRKTALHPRITGSPEKFHIFDVNLHFPKKETCPSGLRSKPGKFVYGKPYREFESLSLRK